MDKGTILKTMPLEPSSQNPSMQIAVIRHVVSGILLHNTIYDVVPLSSKLTVLDTQLPVKQAFKIMHDVGLALVPFWDDRQGTITGMLTASDFVLILRKLQRNIQVIGNEEPISAWKEAKLQFYGGPDAPLNTAKLMFFRVTGYLQIDVGSMDEHSTKSDEEYEGLAMRDVMATGPTMSSKL
ncbi:Sucrose nonfermenting 4-like protein [Zea mays]|nr:Sucrose nonfermenting 4-like protein [Zea mays]